MPELLAASTTQADSADITIAAGASATFLLKGGGGTEGMPRGASANIQAKSGTQYVTIGTLDAENPMAVLGAAGVFRVRKLASSTPVGVDQN